MKYQLLLVVVAIAVGSVTAQMGDNRAQMYFLLVVYIMIPVQMLVLI
jgi:hypothetical protein